MNEYMEHPCIMADPSIFCGHAICDVWLHYDIYPDMEEELNKWGVNNVRDILSAVRILCSHGFYDNAGELIKLHME